MYTHLGISSSKEATDISMYVVSTNNNFIHLLSATKNLNSPSPCMLANPSAITKYNVRIVCKNQHHHYYFEWLQQVCI